MDAKEIKRQIEYWEAILKETSLKIKVLEAEKRQVEQTLKYIKAMLPKEKSNVVEDRTEETSENLQQ